MKTKFLVFVLVMSFISGFTQLSFGETSGKNQISITTDKIDTIYENENSKADTLDLILKHVVKNVNAKISSSLTDNVSNDITVKVEIAHYGLMLKRIPPTRHWITYRVDIVDSNKKVLDSKHFEDGQPSVIDIIEEMSDNILKLLHETISNTQRLK